MTTPNDAPPQGDSPDASPPGQPDPTSADPAPTPVGNADTDDDDQGDDADQPDTPGEARKYRKRAQVAEADRDEALTALAALRQHVIDAEIDRAGYSAKLLAGRDVTEFYTDDGKVDHDKLSAAVQEVAKDLGVSRRPSRPQPVQGQGTSHGQPRTDDWTQAFRAPQQR